jgi:hypothetical protein
MGTSQKVLIAIKYGFQEASIIRVSSLGWQELLRNYPWLLNTGFIYIREPEGSS